MRNFNEQYYDKADPLSIEKYSQKLIGKTFNQIIEDSKEDYSIIREDFENIIKDDEIIKRNKGSLGQLIEEKNFHYKLNILYKSKCNSW